MYAKLKLKILDETLYFESMIVKSKLVEINSPKVSV